MENLKDTKTKIFPSKTRGGKELPSSSALVSPSILSKLAKPPHAINSDMSQVIDDATSAMDNASNDASTLLDDNVPLGEFLDEEIARAKDIENVETGEIIETDEELENGNLETPIRPSPPRYEMPKIPEGYFYRLIMHCFSLEEERVMQQSSVSISLSFLEPRYQSSRRLHASCLVPTQTNKNLATNAIKGLSIPSRPLAKVRSDRDNKINIFGIFGV